MTQRLVEWKKCAEVAEAEIGEKRSPLIAAVLCAIGALITMAGPVSAQLSCSGGLGVVTAHAWPNGRTSGQVPAAAVDGDLSTYTWTTEAFNTSSAHLGIDFGGCANVNRIRLWKDDKPTWGSGSLPKHLVIQYTSDTGPITSRSWQNVPNLVNGFDGAEFLQADAVNANGTVASDRHDSVNDGHGWASLTFDPVRATGLRITFSKVPGTSYRYVHYKVHEFQVIESDCGNGRLDADEECDDGNDACGDDCDPNCMPPACGNGFHCRDAGEECDDGNDACGDDCDPNCMPPACGNGFHCRDAGEECDDGNVVDGDDCSSTCHFECQAPCPDPPPIDCTEEHPCDVLEENAVCPGEVETTVDTMELELDDELCPGDSVRVIRSLTGEFISTAESSEEVCDTECFDRCFETCVTIPVQRCYQVCIRRCSNGVCLQWETRCDLEQLKCNCNNECFDECEENFDTVTRTSFYKHQCGFPIADVIDVRVSDGTCSGELRGRQDLTGTGTAAQNVPLPLAPGTYDVCVSGSLLRTVTVPDCPVPACKLSLPKGRLALTKGQDSTFLGHLKNRMAGGSYTLSLHRFEDDEHTVELSVPSFLQLPSVKEVEEGNATQFEIAAIDPRPTAGINHWANVILRAEGPVVCEVSFDVDIAAPLDHFISYKVRKKKEGPKFFKLGPVRLSDQFGSERYEIAKPRQLLLPADKSDEGVSDAVTHLKEYQIKASRDALVFEPISDVRILNQCNDMLLELKKPTSLLVPTSKDLEQMPSPPDIDEHFVDHYLCYLAKRQTKLADGTRLPRFPRGTQVVVADQFQTRRYDLKNITKLCVPVAKREDSEIPPTILAGSDKGKPFSIEPAPISNESTHLVCYRAKLAKNLIPQGGCGCDRAADPKCKGVKIEPPQAKHDERTGVNTNNQFGPEILDTIKEIELCVPSLKNPETTTTTTTTSTSTTLVTSTTSTTPSSTTSTT